MEAADDNNCGHQPPTSTGKIIVVASIAAGVQFGWALQLSLLTPYVQLLGVPHMWAAFIWLCGPISGLLVQPIVGYYSDRCNSSIGRRRPFIIGGAVLVTVAVVLIGFAADIGRSVGDPTAVEVMKPRAVGIFVVGFWILDVANNTLQGPCRALLGDMAGGDHHLMRTANAGFAFFMAVGNVLGYAAGSYENLHKALPFTKTDACELYCANLKTCFIISVVILLSVTTVAMLLVSEKPRDASRAEVEGGSDTPFFGEMAQAFKSLSRGMWILMLVTCLNWIAWFPFLLFDTDWMGKEVYGGEVDAKGSAAKKALYDLGVRMGSLGLMVNSIVLGLFSVVVEPLVKAVGVKKLWGGVNFVLAVSLALTVWVTKSAKHARVLHGDTVPPPLEVKVGSLAIFCVLGIPLAVTYSIPFALASIFSSTSGAGQGLSLGVLNLAIVFPQMFISVISGPLDAAFGGGNLPAFVLAAIAATVSGILALTVLPSPPQQVKSLPPGGH